MSNQNVKELVLSNLNDSSKNSLSSESVKQHQTSIQSSPKSVKKQKIFIKLLEVS
jgi:hypothetical protein